MQTPSVSNALPQDYIDLHSFLPDEVMLSALVRSYWSLQGYRHRVVALLARLFQLQSPQQTSALVNMDVEQAVQFITMNAQGRLPSSTEVFNRYQAAGFSAVVLHCEAGGNPESEPDRQEKHLGELASANMGRVLPFGAPDPADAERATIYIERAVLRRDFKGMTIRPFRFGRPASDPIWDPIYDACQHLQIPLWIDCSAHLWPSMPMDIQHPSHIDRVIQRFPRLKVIIGQSGWPWVLETMALTMRHHHVYVECSGLDPSFMAKLGSGFEPLFRFGSGLTAHKICFGSQWHFSGRGIEDLMSLFAQTPLSPEVRADWLGYNCRELLGIN